MSFLNIVQSIFLKTFILFIVITYCTCKYKINVTYRIISDKWLTAPCRDQELGIMLFYM